MKKYLLLLLILTSCAPFYNPYGGRCAMNPYSYQSFPAEWQTWEQMHWRDSCSSEDGRAMNGGGIGDSGGYSGGHGGGSNMTDRYSSNPMFRY